MGWGVGRCIDECPKRSPVRVLTAQVSFRSRPLAQPKMFGKACRVEIIRLISLREAGTAVEWERTMFLWYLVQPLLNAERVLQFMLVVGKPRAKGAMGERPADTL